MELILRANKFDNTYTCNACITNWYVKLNMYQGANIHKRLIMYHPTQKYKDIA